MVTAASLELLSVAAGPTKTFRAVKKGMAAGLFNLRATGQSSVEINHRGPDARDMLGRIRESVITMFGIPSTHDVGILPGGARFHFLTSIQNVASALGDEARYLYANTGLWAEAAIGEVAPLLGTMMRIVDISGFIGYGLIPEERFANIDAAHFTTNESADGITWPWQDSLKVPTIIDFSSDGGTSPIRNWQNIAVAYGGTQKIFTVAGYSLVIVRKDLLRNDVLVPSPLNYARQLSERGLGGLVNTISVPVLHGIFIASQEIMAMGGIPTMQALSEIRSDMIYDVIDNNQSVYRGIAPRRFRSKTTITFRLRRPELHEPFLAHLAENGIIGAEGHPSVFDKYGGKICRVSFFAGHTEDDAKRVAGAMKKFARANA